MSASEPPLIVVIGASAGGLKAIYELIENLPTDTGYSFLVMQHLKADHKTMLAPLLQSRTAMPVVEMADNATPQPNHIHVVPPGRTALFENGHMVLHAFDSQNAHQARIDDLLISVAESQGPSAVGVLLSGSGSDGTEGLKHIKSAGGITFAQDSESAEFAQMPAHAINAGSVDMVLAPAAIAQKLAALRDHPLAQDLGAEPTDKRSIQAMLKLLWQHSGFDFSHYKQSTIQRRIRRRMLLKHTQKDAQYLELLRNDANERATLAQDFLINVTALFRDPEVFDEIKREVLPHLLEHKEKGEGLRVWVPGCSTGEEAYSLAIIIAEYLDENDLEVPVQIFATDLDSAAIATARAGVYTAQQVALLTRSRLHRYFVNTAQGHYQVKKKIRGYCIFSEQDVTQDPPFARLDLISCRNLLIYLDGSLQSRLFGLFHFALYPWGRLVLGKSESISNGDSYFSVVDQKQKIYAKKAGRHALPRPLRQMPSVHNARAGSPPETMKREQSIQKQAEQIILDEFSPPGVIVDAELTICRFIGQTGPFIEPAPGSVSLKLLKMAQRDLLVDLRNALARAKETQDRVDTPEVRFNLKEERKTTRIVVQPLSQEGAEDSYYLVLFADTHPEPSLAPEPAPVDDENGEPAAGNQRIKELESELYRARRELKSVINDHVATNEELQNASEQIQSANEELQSTNEELESAQEELQSTNEELATLNDELEARNSDLALVNADLRNLLSSVQLPVLMLNRDLEVRQFTSLAKPLLNLIDTDVGRPFSDLSPNLNLPDLRTIICTVIDQGESQTIEASDNDSNLYSISIRPYKDLDDKVTGVVLVFFDITFIKNDA
ncbi:two-component system CheB/CheR fusion protein [Halospina denitrificans]|uniref:protein-glutamate O-methyltransferase n=1 Tax=Halospina denitrificans TaxID=332522 RepID=A0A4R7K312_9GAMM|nr:two-component system CheB/CheR fusion protein [Halospina denitrificans]